MILFVSPNELIQELVRATDYKFGREVGNDESRSKFEYLRKYISKRP